MEPATSGRREALTFVSRHGWNATASQTTASEFEFFVADEGAVAYVDTGSAWVVAGAPFASREKLLEVTDAFREAARARGKRTCFFAVERRFLEQVPMRAILVAEQPEWDPRLWSDVLRTHRRMREQLRRARKKGLVVRVLPSSELASQPTLLARLREVREDWLETRGMPPMGFLATVPPIDADDERSWLLAERNGRIVAAASLLPVPARAGTLVEHVFREDDAPNGTLETLIDVAMRRAEGVGGEFFTMGMVALSGSVPWLLRLARRFGGFLYSFDGIRRTRARLHPVRWTPLYLAFPEGQSTLLTFVDLLRAFARGSLIRFALATLRYRLDRARRALWASRSSR